MELKEFYTRCKGNYDGVMQRLISEERVKKFLRLFLEDDSYTGLLAAIDKKDFQSAFRCVHNLKGVSSNLNLDSLYSVSSELCEYLRNYRETYATETLLKLTNQVSIQYKQVICLINDLIGGEANA